MGRLCIARVRSLCVGLGNKRIYLPFLRSLDSMVLSTCEVVHSRLITPINFRTSGQNLLSFTHLFNAVLHCSILLNLLPKDLTRNICIMKQALYPKMLCWPNTPHTMQQLFTRLTGKKNKQNPTDGKSQF